MVQAPINALQAEIAASSAKYDYQIDRVQLEYQIGTLPYRTPGRVYRTSITHGPAPIHDPPRRECG
jgi:hypothetical protein